MLSAASAQGLYHGFGPSGSNQAACPLLTIAAWMVIFTHTIQQPEGMAAGQGERQAEVHHEVQMVWHLNMLPGGTPGLKDINLDEYWPCSC